MSEKVKSLILMLLVLSSLYLTYQLWYGQEPADPAIEDVFERIIVERPRPIEKIISPTLIAYDTGEGYVLLKEGSDYFSELWSRVQFQFRDRDDALLIDSINWPENNKALLTCYMKPPLPIGNGLPWLESSLYMELAEINIHAYEDRYYLLYNDTLNGSAKHIELSSAQTDRLRSLLIELEEAEKSRYTPLSEVLELSGCDREFEVRGALFVPAAEEVITLRRILLEPEEFDRDLLLKTFFVDYNLARIIEERDGGLIYTDGDRGLRLSSFGIEYSYPRLEEGLASASYPEALLNSSSLISYHGGWPDGLRLELLNLSGWGRAVSYTAQWRMYCNGLPLYTKKQTMAVFNDRGLIHYSRSLFHPVQPIPAEEEEIEMAVWSEALETALGLYEQNNSGLKSTLRLEAIHPAYVATELVANYYAVPVWFVQINGERLFLRGDTLTQVTEEELK